MASYISFRNTGTSCLRHRLSFTATVWTSFLLHIFDAFLPSSASSDFLSSYMPVVCTGYIMILIKVQSS